MVRHNVQVVLHWPERFVVEERRSRLCQWYRSKIKKVAVSNRLSLDVPNSSCIRVLTRLEGPVHFYQFLFVLFFAHRIFALLLLFFFFFLLSNKTRAYVIYMIYGSPYIYVYIFFSFYRDNRTCIIV